MKQSLRVWNCFTSFAADGKYFCPPTYNIFLCSLFRLRDVSLSRAITAFEKTGFTIARQSKHVVMTNGERIILIPSNADACIQITLVSPSYQKSAQLLFAG